MVGINIQETKQNDSKLYLGHTAPGQAEAAAQTETVMTGLLIGV